jgi:hypothetical protein
MYRKPLTIDATLRKLKETEMATYRAIFRICLEEVSLICRLRFLELVRSHEQAAIPPTS